MVGDFHTSGSLITTVRVLMLVFWYCLMRCLAFHVMWTSIARGRKATEGHVDAWYQTDVNLATTYVNGTQPRFRLVLLCLTANYVYSRLWTDIRYYWTDRNNQWGGPPNKSSNILLTITIWGYLLVPEYWHIISWQRSVIFYNNDRPFCK